MAGLIKEGEDLMKEDADRDVLDAGLIAAAQKVEHYEMAEYGTLRTYARQMGHVDAARLLQQTLDEEGATDKKLTALAESGINVKAMEENGRERAR
jgi:ferritin-like metal-binding protein YciE